MSKANRESTTSITHLVQIVAREEAYRVLNEHLDTSNHHNCNSCKYQEEMTKLGDQLLNRLVSNLEKAGTPWLPAEEELLEQEFRAAIATIAKNHQRSIGAINERLRKRQALGY